MRHQTSGNRTEALQARQTCTLNAYGQKRVGGEGGIWITGNQVSLAEAQRSRKDEQNLEAKGNSPQ